MDRDAMIAEVMKRVGVRLGANDPVFAVVELNRLALEESVVCALERLTPIEKRIASSAYELAATLAAASVRRIQTEIETGRKDIADEAKAARDTAAIAISQIAKSHRPDYAVKCVSIGMMLGAFCTVVAVAVGNVWFAPAEIPPKIHR